jgi:hypothetical protein
MQVRKTTQAHVENVLDCIHGGEGFIEFKMMMEDMDEKAAKGDIDAKKLIKCMCDFSNLLQAAKKFYGNQKVEKLKYPD